MHTKNDERVYRILLDGRWSLEDMTVFSRVYFQNYSFLYCLETNEVGIASSRIESVLQNYELRSGLSYVNIYDIFRSHVAKYDKPQIKAITYASPGWIDLALNPDVATQFAKVLGVYLGAPVVALGSYKKLYKLYSDLSKLRKEKRNSALKLDSSNMLLAQSLNNELAKGLGFASLSDLDNHTKDTEETSKLLMPHCRRVKKIAKFVQDGKAQFPEDNDS